MKKTVIATVIAAAIIGAAASVTGCASPAPVEVTGKTYIADTVTTTYSSTFPEDKKPSALETELSNVMLKTQSGPYTFEEDGKLYMGGVERGTYTQDGANLILTMDAQTQECTVSGSTVTMVGKLYYKVEDDKLVRCQEETTIFAEVSVKMKPVSADSVNGKTFKYSGVEYTFGGTYTEEEKTEIKNDVTEEYKDDAFKFDDTKMYTSSDGGASWDDGVAYKQCGGVVVVGGYNYYYFEGSGAYVYDIDYEYGQGGAEKYVLVKVTFAQI